VDSHLPERRHNKVLVTKNTEYHMRDFLCVAVRDRQTRTWKLDHQAVGNKLVSGITVMGDVCGIHVGQQEVGDKLYFENDLLTTPVETVARPGKDAVASYPIAALGICVSGEALWHPREGRA